MNDFDLFMAKIFHSRGLISTAILLRLMGRPNDTKLFNHYEGLYRKFKESMKALDLDRKHPNDNNIR